MLIRPPQRLTSPPYQSGVALVIVLTALALVSFLVLTILTINRSEQRAATNDSELMDVKALTRLPTDVVISQIRRATHLLGTTYTWTSQPGMLRVFDNLPPPTSPPGSEAPPPPRNQWFYKLYSSDTLYADNTFNPLQEASKLRLWAQQPARFTDLNEPIAVRPRLRQGGASSPQETLVYPILDPSALQRIGDESRVQGVQMVGQPPDGSSRQPLPMPVQWLYVLSDGSFASPLPGADPAELRFDSTLFTPTGNRPERRLAGRIAFWTDDESCKINLNTAGEPAPWSPPHTTSERDEWQAQSQPAQGEWNRQPGHPAFTAVSPVFRSFGEASLSPNLQTQPQPASGQDPQTQAFLDYLQDTLSLLPAPLEPNTGSAHGTEPTTSSTTLAKVRDAPLLHHIDELMFETSVNNLTQRLPNGSSNVGGYTILESDVQRSRFFVTTHSSAPETNPVNQPKISLWPVQAEIQNRTRFDEMMQLASTVGGDSSRRFFGLSRATSWKSSNAPGSAFSSTADLDGANGEVFGWLKQQTIEDGPMGNIPGYGLAFGKKYGRENCDNLLLNIFDLLRWQKNTSQHQTTELAEFDYLAPGWRDAASVSGAGQVTPLRRGVLPDSFSGVTSPPPYLRGHGRIPTLTEAAIVFMASDAKDEGGAIKVASDGYAEKTTKVRAFIILEPFLDSPSGPAYNPAFQIRLLGLNGGTPELPQNATLDGQPLRFGGGTDTELLAAYQFNPSSPDLPVTGSTQRFLGGNRTAYTGLFAPYVNADGQPRSTLGTLNAETEFPWFSIDISLTDDDNRTTLDFRTGDLTAIIEVNDQPVQEIHLPFARLSGQIPVPRLHPEHFDAALRDQSDRMLLDRFMWVAVQGPPRLNLIQRGDVVRSVELSPNGAARGDARHLAARYQVPLHWYAPSQNPPPDPTVFESHSLREGALDALNPQAGSRQIGYSTGPLPDALTPPPLSRPQVQWGSLLPGPTPPPFDAVSPGLNGALARADPSLDWPQADSPAPLTNPNLRYGDWETGLGNLEDGPYVSRIDFSNAITEESAARGNLGVGGLYTRGGGALQDREGISVAPYRSNTTAIQFGALSPLIWGAPANANSDADPEPWRTLLFCPHPASRTSPANQTPSSLDHPGFNSPPDHLWLEYFWTPIVAPRLLSTGFSTEGKINMNFQILPFTWIERSTGIHAAMKGVRIPAIPSSARSVYKTTTGSPTEFTYAINVEETLRAFRERFSNGDVFRYPSEICELYLAPKRLEGRESAYGQGINPPPPNPSALTLEQLNEWWNGDPKNPLAVDAMELTGDNLREHPYAQLYPRLCTRSNVYRVHYRVQLLRPRRSSPAHLWDETKDRVVAEQRGSAIIERFLDLNDPNIPDLISDNPNSLALDEFYRYRIVSQEPFTP